MHRARVCEGRGRPDVSATRPRAASEGGWALLEVVAAAAVLAIVVLGLLAALDATSHTAAGNRQRSVGAALAESDQERMRGMRAQELSGYRETRELTVAGVAYKVASRADWIRDDSSDLESCSNKDSQTAYLRLSSTVTVEGRAAAPPVTMTGLVTPPPGFGAGQGTLAVRVRSATGAPVQNLPVAISGPGSANDVTNEIGCAVFPYIPVGTYQITAGAADWVDKGGNPAASQQGTVTQGNVNTVSLDLDRASAIHVLVQTKAGAAAPQADQSTGVVAANTGVPPSGLRRFPLQTPGSTLDVTGLFPFTDGYTLFSGTCTGADPSKYVPDWFTTHQGVVPVTPGQASGPVTLWEPAVNLHVTRGGNQATAPPWNGPQARVRIYSITDGCDEDFTFPLTTAGSLAAPGPGLPFGHYAVCAEDVQFRRSVVVPDVDDTNPDGTSTIDIWIPTSNTPRNPPAGFAARSCDSRGL